MTRLQLHLVLSMLPDDADRIIVKGVDTDTVFFSSSHIPELVTQHPAISVAPQPAVYNRPGVTRYRFRLPT